MLALRPIIPVSRIDPRNGVTYNVDGNVQQLLRSHDLLVQAVGHPIHRFSPEQTLLASFVAMGDAHGISWPYDATREMVWGYYELICGDFWRRTYSRNFPYGKLQRNDSRQMKNQIHLEATTWIAALNCLKAINEKGSWNFEFPATNLGAALVGLLFDGELLTWFVGYDDPITATERLSRQQSINASLKKGGNPFQQDLTRHFVDVCLALADDYPLLDTAWGDLLKARSSLVESYRADFPAQIDPATGKYKSQRVAARHKSKNRHERGKRSLRKNE